LEIDLNRPEPCDEDFEIAALSPGDNAARTRRRGEIRADAVLGKRAASA
jgi:hypothetical protein